MQRKKYCGKLNNVLDDILLLQQTIWVNELVNKWVQLFANCFVFSNFCSTHDLSNEAQRSPAETYTLYHDFVNSVFAIFKIYLTIFDQIWLFFNLIQIHFLSISRFWTVLSIFDLISNNFTNLKSFSCRNDLKMVKENPLKYASFS